MKPPSFRAGPFLLLLTTVSLTALAETPAKPVSKCKAGEEDVGGGKCCAAGKQVVTRPDGTRACQ